MALLTQKSVVLAKVEGTYASDPTPTTSADAIQVHEVELEITREPEPRQPLDVTMSPLSTILGLGEIKLNIKTPLKGSGSAGTAPDWLVLATACGMYNTNVGSTSDTLKPDDTPTTSCTVYVYKDGLLYKCVGCRGNVKQVWEAGKIVMLEFELMGRFDIPTDVSLPSAITVDATKARAALGTTFTFGSYAAIIEKLELDMGNEVVRNENLNATYGVESFEITKRLPKGKMTVNAVLRATSNADFWSYMNAATSKALSMAVGSGAGEVCTTTAPVCIITSIKPATKNGIDVFEIEFDMVRSSGGDEFVIALT